MAKTMTENEQRRFGITENLLKTKVSLHYRTRSSYFKKIRSL